MSDVAVTYQASNETTNGPAGLIVRIGFLLGMISAIWDRLQRRRDQVLRHARWGARW